jgi:hypothetical protein
VDAASTACRTNELPPPEDAAAPGIDDAPPACTNEWPAAGAGLVPPDDTNEFTPAEAEATTADRKEGAYAILRRRVERLLDRRAPRRADELDLAEAICAVKWPDWPGYTGAVDLLVLRRVLQRFTIAPATLHWLGSHELERMCRAAGPAG